MGLGGNDPKTLAVFREVFQRAQKQWGAVQGARLFRTVPQEDKHQAQFWNSALAFSSSQASDVILKLLLEWEIELGRRRDPFRPKGPRLIDLDLLISGNEVWNQAEIVLPHPRLKDRRFALEPLLDLEPNAIDPVSGVSWFQICHQLQDQGVDPMPWSW